MALSALDIQTAVAYRLGEDAAVSDTNESARRLSYINEAYRSVLSKSNWWFTEKVANFSSVANKESYSSSDGVPTDIRTIIELRYDNTLYGEVQQTDIFSGTTKPYSNVSNSFYLFGGLIYPIPVFTTNGSNNVSLKYYAGFTKLTSNASTLLIPELYQDVIVAYVYARVSLTDDLRGAASDAFDEFNELLNRLVAENNRYLFSHKSFNTDSDLTVMYQ